MPISTGHKKVRTNTKPHRRPPQYIYHHCHVTPGLGLLVSACIHMLPMLGQVGEHLQLTTMYHMNNINQGGVSYASCHSALPSFNNVATTSHDTPERSSEVKKQMCVLHLVPLWCSSWPPHSASQSPLWPEEEGGGCGVGSTATDEWGH